MLRLDSDGENWEFVFFHLKAYYSELLEIAQPCVERQEDGCAFCIAARGLLSRKASWFFFLFFLSSPSLRPMCVCV